MSLYVLDTDHVSLVQREHPVVMRRLAARQAREIAVTIITAEEQMRGWLNAIRRAARSRERLRWAYAGLRSTLDFYRTARVLDFDQPAILRYDELRQQKIRVGTLDLRIAAISLVTGATLVTRNERDFMRVPGLVVENWSTEESP